MIMRLDVEDTIVALATARGPAWRGILRISGSRIFDVITRLVDSGHFELTSLDSLEAIQKSASFATRLFLDGVFVCDAELIIWPDRFSFTRQPCAELHMLGSPPILEKALELFVANGCRLAEPGEFTMRAFLSGRLDLTQAEAVLGLIDARNQRQFASQLSQLAGGVGEPIKDIKERLIFILAEIEAGLDFVDEDIEFVSHDQVTAALNEAESKLGKIIAQLCHRKSSHDEVTVVFAGEPNAGKSSLFNCLSSGRAIVSDVPGTTRDYLTAIVTWRGVKIRLVDTAGLEGCPKGHLSSAIENKMQLQTKAQVSNADIVVVCRERGASTDALEWPLSFIPADSMLMVNTKLDLVMHEEKVPGLWISTVTQEGIDELQDEILFRIDAANFQDTSASATAVRVADSLNRASERLSAAKYAAENRTGEEFVAAEIRGALEQLGIVVGTVYTDDILDVVFSRFCIGK